MASTAAVLKGAVVIAVIAVLLHSSTGQQQAPAPAPSPPLNCSMCGMNCTQRCQAIQDAQGLFCNTTYGPNGVNVYNACFDSVTTHTCNGNSYVARGSCTMDTCSAKFCGNPCARSACESCTNAAQGVFYSCLASVGRVMQFCMPDCMNHCQEFGYCVSS